MPVPSIRKVGPRRWFNSEAQRAMHNGHGFERLLYLFANPPDGLGWAPYRAAQEFNTVERTAYYWRTLLIEEGYLTKEGDLAKPAPTKN